MVWEGGRVLSLKYWGNRCFLWATMFRRLAILSFLVSGVSWGNPLSGVASGQQSLLGPGASFSIIPEMPERVRVENDGSIFYDKEKNTVLYTGTPLVKVKTDKGTEMFAQSALLNMNEKRVDLAGNVSIFQGMAVSRGDSAQYYWETEELATQGLKTKVNAFLLESNKFVVRTDENGRSYYEGKDAGITLQDVDNPDSWLRATHIRLYPEDSVEFSNMVIYADEVPVFYFPYFSHSLNPRLGYLPTPGSRSIWGAYLNNEYGFVIGEKYVESGIPTGDFIGIARYDYRTRRGSAVGFDVIDVKMEKKAPDFKGLSLYFADDLEPNIQLEGIPRDSVSPDRWRVALQENVIFSQGGLDDWRLRGYSNISVLSDQYMLEDFFPRLVMHDQAPDNVVAMDARKDTSVLTLMTRFAANDYYKTDERYPELTWDRVRGSVWDSPFVYEGTTSAGVMRNYLPGQERALGRYLLSKYPENDPRRETLIGQLSTDPFMRVHTYHEWALPKNYKDFLTITPKMGGGYTGYYGVEDIGDYNRGLFFGGMDVAGRITGDFSSVSNYALGLNGLRHVIEPYVNYSYVATDHINPYVPQLDDLSFSTNPVALSVGRFTAIDALSNWNTMRFGVRNLFLTKRAQQTHHWMTWDVFVDAHLDDSEPNQRFSNMYSQMNWNPKPWMRFYMLDQFPVVSSGSGYQEHNFGVAFMPTRSLELDISNSNLTNHPQLYDSNLLNLGVNMRISEDSSLSAVLRWELNDTTLERQEYMYYRNMGSWVIGLGYYSYYNRIQYDRGVMLTFTLRDMPETNIPMRF